MPISRISTYSQFLFSQRVLQNNEQQRQLYSTRLSTGRKFLELSRYRGSMTDLIKFGAEHERLEETRSALTTVDAVLSKYNSLIESQSSDGQFSGLINLVDTWLGQLAEARTSVIGQQQDKLDDWQRAVRNPLENALRTITSTLNTELAGRRIFAGGGDARYRQPPSIDLELATRAEGSSRAELAAYSGELLRQLEEDNEDRFDGFFTDDDPDDPDARLSAGNRLSVASTERPRNYNSPSVPEPNLEDFLDEVTGNFRIDPGGVRNYRDEYVEALEAHLDSFRPEDFTPAAYDRDFTGFDVPRPDLDDFTDVNDNFATAQDRADFEAALLRYQQAFVPDAFRFQVVHSDATAIHEYGIHANEGAFQYLVEGFRAFRTLATVNLGRKTIPDPPPDPAEADYDGYHDLEVFDLNFQALVLTTEDPDDPDSDPVFERDADDNLTRGDFIDQEALRLLVIRVEKLLQTAKDELELVLNRNALVQSGLRLRLDRVKTDIGETQKRVDSIRAIDEDATAVFLSNTRLQIEASYRAITQANELSLLNFLR